MLWQVTIASTELRSDLDQRSTGKEDTSIGKKRLLEERECYCTHRLDLDRAKGTGRPVPWTVELVGPVPRQVQHFDPKNLFFFMFFSLLTLRQGLQVN